LLVELIVAKIKHIFRAVRGSELNSSASTRWTCARVVLARRRKLAERASSRSEM